MKKHLYFFISSVINILLSIYAIINCNEIVKELTNKIVQERFPVLWQLLSQQKMDSTLFVPQWFMVAFLNAGFDFQLSSFIFDQFLAFGCAPLLSLGLAILEIHKELFTHSIEEILQLLSNPGNSKKMTKQAINVAWAKHWITTKQFNEMMRTTVSKIRKDDNTIPDVQNIIQKPNSS